jgi:hypothetical protein
VPATFFTFTEEELSLAPEVLPSLTPPHFQHLASQQSVPPSKVEGDKSVAVDDDA